MPRTKIAKIGRFGGRMCDYSLAEDATYEDLLAVGNETLKKGETLTVNGETVDVEDEVEDGDEVVIVPSTTGA